MSPSFEKKIGKWRWRITLTCQNRISSILITLQTQNLFSNCTRTNEYSTTFWIWIVSSVSHYVEQSSDFARVPRKGPVSERTTAETISQNFLAFTHDPISCFPLSTPPPSILKKNPNKRNQITSQNKQQKPKHKPKPTTKKHINTSFSSSCPLDKNSKIWLSSETRILTLKWEAGIASTAFLMRTDNMTIVSEALNKFDPSSSKKKTWIGRGMDTEH